MDAGGAEDATALSSVGGGRGGSGAAPACAELEPREGMEFASCEEATAFYYEYASREGFRVTRKCSHRSKRDKLLLEIQFVCFRYGKKREKPHALFRRYSMKMGCGAALSVRRKEGASTWFVHYFVRDHNHELGKAKKPQIPRPPRVGDEEARGLQKPEDAPAMLEFFLHMQLQNPNFFYALSLDDDRRLKNVLWVDAKARHDYKDFGDAVLLDAVCVTNKYRLPLATVSGVNNHGQPLLFGCALLADATVSSFVWVMKTWLKAVGGRPPKAITVDQQHEAIKTAVEDAFPSSRCRFCTSHVAKKVSQKLGYITEQSTDLVEQFDKCLYKSLTEEDFERRWSNMIAKFELHEHEWLRSLYEDRRFWEPTYLRETFSGGVISSSRTALFGCNLL
uniref:Protein FAR1-RELATED SEQUENCE n=1 Tax=Anthurium amnicola TaxID=1678845 RepID=A0A1D1Z4D8_9ARAE